MFVLVLNIEKPDRNGAECRNNGKMNPCKGFPAQPINQGSVDEEQEHIVPEQGLIGHLPSLQPDNGKTVVVKDVKQGPQEKQHRSASEKPVLEFLHSTQCPIFLNGQRIDIADIPVLIQNAVVAMVIIVVFCPVLIRNKRQKAACCANDIIGFSGCSKRLVTAIVLNDENPDQEKGIDNSQSNSKPDGYIAPNVHGNPDGKERQERIQDLNGGFLTVG